MAGRSESLGEHVIAAGIKKRKRLETLPEEVISSDEAKYAKQEEKAVKRMADSHLDYDHTSIKEL